MKFRAHDTFFVRKGWLAKGMRNVAAAPDVFTSRENNPMDVLGIGANMVKALRYWLVAVGLTREARKNGRAVQRPTEIGEIINEYDPYRNACQGQSTYVVGQIEDKVVAVVRQYFSTIRSAPTVEMLTAAGIRNQHIKEDSLAHAEVMLKKAQVEMTALEEEAIKALTGESKMDPTFINSLITKRRTNLDSALKEVERLRSSTMIPLHQIN